jgi:hypothetical protein
MPILDFPPSPSVGQIYENESSGTYRWNGYAWDRVNAYIVPIGVPDGAILMWSGSIAAIPPSFVLCDGTNGTPDLRDRFIVGAGSSFAPLATGGTKDAVVVSHTHTGTVSGSTDAVGDHVHSVGRVAGGSGPLQFTPGAGMGDITPNTSPAGAHSHTLNGSIVVASAGESGTNKNLPPFFALAFIMKVAA